jgi:hypothetical protein
MRTSTSALKVLWIAATLLKLTFSRSVPICPKGYTAIAENLDGKGKVWSKPHPDRSRTIGDCARICDGRNDCTGFEYAEGRHETGACGTYTGGNCNVRRNEGRLKKGSNWRSCQKDHMCPFGFTAISENLDGKGKVWSKPHPNRCRTIYECAKICDRRSGCTGFEYAKGPRATGACGTYTGGISNIRNDEKRLEKRSNWLSCQKDPICPEGYTAISENLDGKGKVWSKPHPDKSRTIDDCARICDGRNDCTGFEYAEGPHETGACGTYSGGNCNVQRNEGRLKTRSNWRSCQKDQMCPIGYTAISENLDGKGKVWSKPHPNRCRTVYECAKICDRRSGCTGFEYAKGPRETGACGTYTGGISNIGKDEKRLEKRSNWRSCLRI